MWCFGVGDGRISKNSNRIYPNDWVAIALSTCPPIAGAGTRVIKLTAVVTSAFTQRAVNPALNPRNGSCLVEIRNMERPTPVTIPAATPAAVAPAATPAIAPAAAAQP